MGNSLSSTFKATFRRTPRGNDSSSSTALEKSSDHVVTNYSNVSAALDGQGTTPVVEDDNELNDPDLKNCDNGMKQRTEKVLGSLENGMKQGGLELSVLEDVTNGLLGMNEDVVNYILECDLDVWANEEMKELVTDYFKNSLEALDFCTVLESCVRSKLDRFLEAKNPFFEFQDPFKAVYDWQWKLQEKLAEKRRKYHRKERNLRVMKKITTVILTASCVSLVVCAAVAMAVASPVLAGGVTAAASLPFDAMHSWLNKLWAHYEQRIRTERGIVDAAHWGTWVAIKDLDTTETEVRRLKSEIEAFSRNIEFARERGDSLAVQNFIRMIRMKNEQFVKQLYDLSAHVNECISRINKARGVVISCPSLSSSLKSNLARSWSSNIKGIEGMIYYPFIKLIYPPTIAHNCTYRATNKLEYCP
ncbi:hypothetical protein R1flu_002123 [Riccia fluitans]|uniref:Uncharacterized protein n=1 Tax=Riccia fluitans TaxID=41844 RepID=A0ABD1Y5H4_9MARC